MSKYYLPSKNENSAKQMKDYNMFCIDIHTRHSIKEFKKTNECVSFTNRVIVFANFQFRMNAHERMQGFACPKLL